MGLHGDLWLIRVAVCVVALLASVAPALAQRVDEPVARDNLDALDLEEALALVAARAPRIDAQRARLDEVRAQRTDATLALRDNPELDLELGPRLPGLDDGSITPVVGVGWTQRFELGGQRAARIDAADAAEVRALAEVELAVRELQAEVGASFLNALAAQERLEIAQTSLALAEDSLAIETRKSEAGDASQLEVVTAQLAVERARAEVGLAQAELLRARAELSTLLAVEPAASLQLEGRLSDHLPDLDADALDRDLERRPERAALEAALTEAQAQEALGEAMAWPDLSLRLGYEYDEGTHAVLTSIGLTLPLFDDGQAARQTAVAQAATARVEAAIDRETARLRTTSRLEVYLALRQSLTDYERQVLVLLDQAETMARTAHEAGAMSLAEILSLRGELVAARSTHVELTLQAALAAFEVRLAAGALP